MRTVDQVRSFLDGAELVEVRPLDRGARDEFVARTLRRFRYGQPGKDDKGVVRRFLVKVSGLSRAQPTRLIARHRSTGRIDDLYNLWPLRCRCVARLAPQERGPCPDSSRG